jgi:hypothetical protein
MAGDAYYNQVELLLHGEGQPGSKRFRDSSRLRRSPTHSGSVHISSTQAKVGNTSIYFDGASAQLRYLRSSPDSIDFGTSDFTLEFWVHPVATRVGNCGVFNTKTASGDSGWHIDWSSTLTFCSPNNATTLSVAPLLDVWTHIAFVRSAGVLYGYVDGVNTGSVSLSTSLDPSSAYLDIGKASWSANYFPGYLDEVRITTGVARYTANFAPVVEPLPDGMAMFSGAVLDDSGSSASRQVRVYNRITGELISSVYSEAGDPLYWRNSLLLHGDMGQGSKVVLDSSPNNLLSTTIGSLYNSTSQRKFGWSSLYFNGTTDAVSFPASEELNLVGSDFTIETWVYLITLNTAVCLCQKDKVHGVSNPQYLLSITSSGSLTASVGTGTNESYLQTLTTASGLITTGAWHHVAFSKSGSNLNLFVGGSLVQSVVQLDLMTDGGGPLLIGRAPSGGGAADQWMKGYLDDFRITKGAARYTTSFSAPTSRHPDRQLGNKGEYSLWVPTIDPHSIVGLDDVQGVTYSDLLQTRIPTVDA